MTIVKKPACISVVQSSLRYKTWPSSTRLVSLHKVFATKIGEGSLHDAVNDVANICQ